MEEAVPILDEAGSVVAEESADGTGWRTRVSLHVDDSGRVGPFAARSHRVIQTHDLPLATAAVSRAAAELRAQAPGRVDLVEPADGRVRVLPRSDEAPRTRGAAETVLEQVGARAFRVDVGGFWQVHRLAAHSLTTIVAEELRALAEDGVAVDPDASHLDLYGGVGLFAATLGDLGGASTRVVSVESAAAATEHAGANLAEWARGRAGQARVARTEGRRVGETGVR